VIGLGLRQLQDALNGKADRIQHEFVLLSEELEDVGRKLLEADEADRPPLRDRQQEIRERQMQVADNVNVWRERARNVIQQRGSGALRAYLEELASLEDEQVQAAAKHALYLMDAPEEELAALADQSSARKVTTPAGRLIERARTEYDLRTGDPATRMRAAVEFANRSGVAQDLAALDEIEAAMEDPDPLVREIAALTVAQLLKFRSLRLADLDASHTAVQRLAKVNHMAAIPVLIDVLNSPRTGFVTREGESIEEDNGRSRMVALLRLVEWHTPDAQYAMRGLQFDRDPHIVKAAKRALELFPGDWTGRLPKPQH
jgi:HEAT repeat protein